MLISDIKAGELHGRSGSIQAAINLEIPQNRLTRFNLKINGLNGQLPNLDLVNTVVKLCRGNRIIPTLSKRVSSNIMSLVFNMVTFKCSFPVHLLKNIGFLHKIYNYEYFSFTINFLSTYNKKLQWTENFKLNQSQTMIFLVNYFILIKFCFAVLGKSTVIKQTQLWFAGRPLWSWECLWLWAFFEDNAAYDVAPSCGVSNWQPWALSQIPHWGSDTWGGVT